VTNKQPSEQAPGGGGLFFFLLTAPPPPDSVGAVELFSLRWATPGTTQKGQTMSSTSTGCRTGGQQAMRVTNHIKSRKKDGLSHDRAKAEAYIRYGIKRKPHPLETELIAALKDLRSIAAEQAEQVRRTTAATEAAARWDMMYEAH
jgi:hypothetical protein